MRLPRMKIPREESGSFQHCFSRTPNGEFLFDDVDMEMLRLLILSVTRFCGVALLTYHILHNHFHILFFVPPLVPVSDEMLLLQYQALYPKPTPRRPQTLDSITAMLKKNGPEAAEWRQWMLEMCDVSICLKIIKERFTAWYNARHNRFGTLWSGRFGNVLVESGTALFGTMAYVDLNCIRAGLVQDPKDYRFCGYADAVAGNDRLRRGIMETFGIDSWDTAHAQYRTLLIAVGVKSKENAASIAEEQFRRVMKEGGKLPLATVVCCKAGYFTRGAVLGSQLFVAKQMQRLRDRKLMKLVRDPIALPETEWGEWATLRAVRRRAGELYFGAATA